MHVFFQIVQLSFISTLIYTIFKLVFEKHMSSIDERNLFKLEKKKHDNPWFYDLHNFQTQITMINSDNYDLGEMLNFQAGTFCVQKSECALCTEKQERLWQVCTNIDSGNKW